MRDKRGAILDNPEKLRRSYVEAHLPDDYDDLHEDEQQQITADLEGVVAAFDPASLREEHPR